MRKSKLLGVALAASMAASSVFSSTAVLAGTSPSPPGHLFGHGTPAYLWVIFGCAEGVVTAAIVKNWKYNQQLTAQEAWTCGFLYWWNEATGHH
jgi:hypothetical protein